MITSRLAREGIMSTQSSGFPVLAPYNLNQPILPWTFSGITVNYAGNPSIEKNVIETVASYGRQLGILTEAVLKLANQSLPTKSGVPVEDPIARLRDLAEQIEKLKEIHKTALLREARDAMDRLARDNPDSARYVASSYGDGASGPSPS
jgi:hypothetical protein